jgi:hypothetical protein
VVSGMSRKTMIIVGNATPDLDLSNFVDGCDIVVRLNATGNLGSGRVGARTDILCLRSFGSIGQRFASGADALHPRAVESAAELWFVGEAGNWAPAIIDRYDLASKRHRFFSLARMRRVDRILRGFGGARQGASLGAIAVILALEEAGFEPLQKWFCAFRFQGWSGHPWVAEKRLFETCCCQGSLHTPEPRPYFALTPVLRRVGHQPDSPGPGSRAEAGENDETETDATRILPLLDGRRTVEDICDVFQSASGYPASTSRATVLKLLWRLEDEGAVEWAGVGVSRR